MTRCASGCLTCRRGQLLALRSLNRPTHLFDDSTSSARIQDDGPTYYCACSELLGARCCSIAGGPGSDRRGVVAPLQAGEAQQAEQANKPPQTSLVTVVVGGGAVGQCRRGR